MLLGGIQIPADVLTAQEEGRLVIFTGAGISMSPPSNLPNFEGLAARVAQMLQSSLDPASSGWRGQLDTFMDVLNEGEDVDVHRLVRGIVDDRSSSPNANHQALARISTKKTVRIVTTNYDPHLETALRANSSGELEVYRAPALPLGDDFEGLVYLHGSAHGDPQRLVVTDRDFSLAYFHSAWAARFLERMFREYVVLFVGYSHSDVVMKYLGLGLGSKSKRYVFTDKPDDSIWKRLHVTPLPYPPNEHHILTQCLVEWSNLGGMGLLDHRQRIRELVQSPSQPTPDELSYLEDSLRRPERVGFFREFAKDRYWLGWATGQEPFQRLFRRSADPDEVSICLAEWFTRFVLMDDDEAESTNTQPWAILAEAGGVLGTPLWNALARAIHAATGPRPSHALRWVWVLLEQEHPGCWSDFLDHAFTWDELWADRSLSLALLDHLLQPRVTPQRAWGSSHMAVTMRGDRHLLDRAWDHRFRPALGYLAVDVHPIAERALLRHLNLEAAVGRSSLGLSRRRSAVQTHPQDRYRNPADVVIDAVRDCAIELARSDPDFTQQVVERWIGSNHMMLRRLAVHVIGTSESLDANDKVQFVLDRHLAGVDDIAQEVFHLLGSTAKEADRELVDQLIVAYRPTASEPRDQHRSFAALEWLERCGVENTSLTAALVDLRQQLGDIEGSPYPGLRGWTEVFTNGNEPPLSTEEFDERVKANPEEAVALVLSFPQRTHPRTGSPNRDDALGMLRATVEKRASAGVELWPYLDAHFELQAAVVSAWGHAHEAEDLTLIVGILMKADLVALDHALGQLFLAARSVGAPWEEIPAIDDFIQLVWEACSTDEVFEPGGEDNWDSETINRPAGQLMDFWFEIFRRRWAAAGGAWRGLTDGDRSFLEEVLSDRTKRGAYALTQIAARLHFLDAADSGWCRSQLLPYRDWADALMAEPFWWGVLSWARWNGGLAEAGLLEGLLETAGHLDTFGDDQQHRWASMLASMAVGCETPSTVSWVDQFTAIAGSKRRAEWLAALVQNFEDLDAAGRTSIWEEWLACYWHRRNQSQPTVLVPQEANALAAIAPLLPTAHFEAAVGLVMETTAGLDAHGGGLSYITDELVDSHPREVGQYLAHLMEHTQGSFWAVYDLEPKLRRLVALPGEWKRVREAALSLGIKLD